MLTDHKLINFRIEKCGASFFVIFKRKGDG